MSSGAVYESADKYPENYLRCRGDRQHPWDLVTDWNLVTGPRGRLVEFTRTRVCTACGTKAHVTYSVDATGRLSWAARRYEYAEGYLLRKGSTIDPALLRDELFLREIRESLGDEVVGRLVRQMERSRKPGAPGAGHDERAAS